MKKVWNNMRITRLWHRCEVSRCCWEDGLNRLARHRGATNMQFVKRKENALSVNSNSLGKKQTTYLWKWCLPVLFSWGQQESDENSQNTHTPRCWCGVRVQTSGPRLGAWALWRPRRSNRRTSPLRYPPQAWTDPPEHWYSCHHSRPWAHT